MMVLQPKLQLMILAEQPKLKQVVVKVKQYSSQIMNMQMVVLKTPQQLL